VLSQFVGDRAALLAYLRSTPQRAVLIMDDPVFAAQVQDVLPLARIIHRRWQTSDAELHMTQSPDEFIRQHSNIDRRLFVQVLNEPSGTANVDRLVKWLVDVIAAAPGWMRLCVANFSVGNPGEADVRGGVYDPLIRALANTRHALGLHEYWKDNPTQEPWHVGRFKMWMQRARDINVNPPRIIITEFGRDVAGGHDGWKAAGYSEQQYADMCAQAHSRYYASEGIDALTFCYGRGAGNRWDTFNVEGANAWLASVSAYNRTLNIPPAPPAPTPDVPPPVDSLGAPIAGRVLRTSSNTGVNLRTAPETSAAIVRVLKVGDNVTFRPQTWRGNGQEWRRIEEPAGWVSETVCDIGPASTGAIKMLAVPFRSQTGPGAGRYGNDCGVACALMLLNYLWTRAGYGELLALSVDDMAADSALPTGDRPQTLAQIITLLSRYGIRAQARRPFTRGDIVRAIEAGLPTITLVRYKHLNPAAGVDFGHYVVPIGYSADGVYVHDPLHGGAGLYVANAAFDAALSDLGAAGLPNQSIVLEGI